MSLRALGFNNVFETNFGLVHTPDLTKANMRAFMWDKMKDWLLHGAIETDEKMAAGLAGGCSVTTYLLSTVDRVSARSRFFGGDMQPAVAASAANASAGVRRRFMGCS